MYDLEDDDDDRDYWPNDLAELSDTDPKKYRQIVESNLHEGDTIETWQQRNLEMNKRLIEHQLKNRGNDY